MPGTLATAFTAITADNRWTSLSPSQRRVALLTAAMAHGAILTLACQITHNSPVLHPSAQTIVIGDFASAMLIGTYVLLKFYVPRRVAFAITRSQFEQFIAQAHTPAPQSKRISLNRKFGVYRVDSYGADPRGGVYFRVHSGQDGLGPDVMS